MKMRTLFSYFLTTMCCGGMLFADLPKEEGERVQVTIVENVEQALAEQEERAIRALEIAGGEDNQILAVESEPAEESAFASRAAVEATFDDAKIINRLAQANSLTYVTYPGAYHTLISAIGNELRIEDGSWWKISRSDLNETSRWRVSDQIVITANGDWPLYSPFRYHLTNQRNSKYVRANLNDFYNVSETRFIYSHIWLYDAFGNLYVQLTLNDGSIWNMLPVDAQCFQWKNGDIIIVGLNTDQYSAITPYMLINVRTNDNGGAACVLYYE